MGTVVTVQLSREAGEKLMAKFNAGECPELEAIGVTKIEPKLNEGDNEAKPDQESTDD